MGVTTTKTNKPFNPRAQDQSPKGFNRAKLFSGKALDFDGVNDYIDLAGFTMTGTNASFLFNLKADAYGALDYIIDLSPKRLVFGTNIGNDISIYDSVEWHKFADFSDTTNTNNFALTIEGTTAKLYLNGQSFGNTVTLSTTIDLSATTEFGLMSRRNFSSNFFDGQLSGFKIFNTALTVAQVADLYNNPEKVVPTGVDNTALKLWLPMMEGAGTTAYDGAPGALGSNVVTNGTFDTDLTGWSTNDFSNGSIVQSSGTALITSNGGSGYPSIWQQVSTIVGERYIVKANFSNNTTGVWFWKFDDNTPLGSTNRVQFIDNDATTSIDGVFEFTATSTLSSISAFAEQGNAGSFNLDNVEVLQISNVGTISGATWTHGIGSPVGQTSVIDWNKHTLDGTNEVLIPQGLTAGRDLLGNLFENVRKQGALNLDGNSWAEVHDNASLDITPAMTMEVWVYAGEKLSGVYDHIFVKQDATTWASPYGRYVLRMRQDRVQWWFDSSSNIANYNATLTGWNHLVATKDGASEKLYVNGSEVATNTGAATITASAYSLLIGSRTGHSLAEIFPHPLAQPRIYNRALTAEEVQRNYNAGKNTYTN